MKKYSESDNYILYQGNMLDMLQEIKENSIDSIVTDPPYELNFMNKGWDNSGIAFQKETWEKCYDVLKPGGYLLAFGGTRTYHRIACAIEDAGFEIRDCTMWLYGSGFPKSMDISKQIDKRPNRNNENLLKFANKLKKQREKLGYSKKQIDDILGTNTAYSWWEGRNYLRQFVIQLPDKENYLKLKEILLLNDDMDFIFEKAEREIIGQKEKTESYQYKNNNVYQTNGNKDKIILDITKPASELAKQWEGWGTCLKPAYEPVIVARKPFKGSLVDNVIENGVGGLNIDECRVGNETRYNSYAGNKNTGFTAGDTRTEKGKGLFAGNKEGGNTVEGRFPANVILTYDENDFDEVCGNMPYTKGGNRKNTIATRKSDKTSFGYEINTRNEFNDEGSASRYFYCAKASKKDRDEGLDEFEEKQTTDGNIRSNSETARKFGANSALRKNIHPTVKPTELMQYLIKLVTPKNGIILDPFMGSGSTGKACMYENKERNANYKFIGIELTEEYLPIAEARINYAKEKSEEENKEKQISIFDLDKEVK